MTVPDDAPRDRFPAAAGKPAPPQRYNAGAASDSLRPQGIWQRPLGAVLVANRGEIAVRVLRTCRRLGIRGIAVHTDLDATAPHVLAADDAVQVASYLDVEAPVAAAVATGADAVHPGYGFLSESAAFARAVVQAGLVFVGPTADVVDLMGRKDAAREVAVAAGVPVLPQVVLGADGSLGAEVAFPLLVKAAAGGGGKGMRVVRGPGDLEAALAAARREAMGAFGDDAMLLERYVERGRHIEVQVLADTHGTVLHLFERDCSTQRRHQKVLEEAPAPTLDAATRERVTAAAVDLARSVGYVGVGTVEFLLDDDTGDVAFLEMNTRLQVEHPVTEAICGGVDLVEHQLRVAAGEPLAFGQDDLVVHGHAIEARVYAEDPYAGFLPQAGTADLVRWPTGVRVDHALASGQVVSTAYDPMLGKVVAHGPDRESARRALVAALDDTAVLGLTTNVGFLRDLAASEAFRDATIDTAWLDRTSFDRPADDLARVFAAWVRAMLVAEGGTPHPFRADGWRLAGARAPVRVELDRPVLVDRAAGVVRVLDPATGEPTETRVRQLSAERHVAVLSIDGRRERAVVNAQGTTVEVVLHGHRHVFRSPDGSADRAVAPGTGSVCAPMPGTVLSVAVTLGQAVAAGDVLGILEAMKMELSLTAPVAGTVVEVRAAAGDRVPLGATVFVVAPAPVSGEPR